MLSSEYFYNYFQLNHFDYKQEANRHLLEMDDKTFEATYKGIINLNRIDYDRTIKMDIRFTFLLAVETLFEFIFALLPEEDGSLNDKKILQRLAEKNHYNAEIRKFAKEEPNRLDENFKKDFYYKLNGKLRSKPLIQQLFYAGVEQERVEQDLKKCTDVIYRSLRVLAKEVANRTELNSYKHGFKAIPYFRTFEFQDPQTKKNLIELDLRDSVSNFVFDEKKGNLAH